MAGIFSGFANIFPALAQAPGDDFQDCKPQRLPRSGFSQRHMLGQRASLSILKRNASFKLSVLNNCCRFFTRCVDHELPSPTINPCSSTVHTDPDSNRDNYPSLSYWSDTRNKSLLDTVLLRLHRTADISSRSCLACHVPYRLMPIDRRVPSTCAHYNRKQHNLEKIVNGVLSDY